MQLFRELPDRSDSDNNLGMQLFWKLQTCSLPSSGCRAAGCLGHHSCETIIFQAHSGGREKEMEIGQVKTSQSLLF